MNWSVAAQSFLESLRISGFVFEASVDEMVSVLRLTSALVAATNSGLSADAYCFAGKRERMLEMLLAPLAIARLPKGQAQ